MPWSLHFVLVPCNSTLLPACCCLNILTESTQPIHNPPAAHRAATHAHARQHSHRLRVIDPEPGAGDTYTPIVLNTPASNTSMVVDKQRALKVSAADVLHRGSGEDGLAMCADEGEIELFERLAAATEGAGQGHERAGVRGHDAEDFVVALELFQQLCSISSFSSP